MSKREKKELILPIMKNEGAQTSTKYFKSSLKTQWYSNDLQSLAFVANAEQFFFLAASSYAVNLVGHSSTRCTVFRDALQGMVNESANLSTQLD